MSFPYLILFVAGFCAQYIRSNNGTELSSSKTVLYPTIEATEPGLLAHETTAAHSECPCGDSNYDESEVPHLAPLPSHRLSTSGRIVWSHIFHLQERETFSACFQSYPNQRGLCPRFSTYWRFLHPPSFTILPQREVPSPPTLQPPLPGVLPWPRAVVRLARRR